MTHPTRAFSGSIINRFTGSKILARVGQISVAFPIEKEKELDSIFKDLLTVVDAFDKADKRLADQYVENDDVQKARKRFATSKRKLLEILNRNNVNEIQFPDGIATLEDCQVADTEPDATKPNNTIISIEKNGYRRNGRLLRLAEVIVVKN